MTLRDLVEKFDLHVVCGEGEMERPVTGCYASDLLSDVMGRSARGNLWITLQVHPNIVAVASMRELAAVVMIGGRTPLEETVDKAREQGVPLLTSPLSSFELCGRLYQAGLRGVS